MTATILSVLLSITFTLLGVIHLYWLFGGKWGLKQVIPTKTNKASSLPPPRFATLIITIILVFFGLIYFVKSGLISIPIPKRLTAYTLWFIPSVFLLRAIGEFKYVGFFKTITDTEFAKADSKWFSPLCLIIGIFGIVIQVF